MIANSTPRNDNATGQGREGVTANQSKMKVITKLDRVINLLKTRPDRKSVV